jgi:hypothetical protein
MKYFILVIFLSFCLISPGFTQVNGFVKTGILAGTRRSIPFWMLTNEFGRYSPRPENVFLDAGVFPDTIELVRNLKIDLGAEVFGRYDGVYRRWLQQGYAGVRAGFLYFYAGVKEEHFGSQDPELSSGFILWSGNARPLPKVSLSTRNFVRVPFTRGFVEFKAGIAHGWFGDKGYVKNSYLHHKYLYLKFGGSNPLHLTAGLHHFAEWGGISPQYGQLPAGMKNFMKVFLAHEGRDSSPGVPYNEWANRYGNHLGTKDISIDYRFKGGVKIKAYWQNFIEDITGLGFRNISDGLWGIHVEDPGRIKIGYEFFRSITHRSEFTDSIHTTGTDNYFDNGIYRSGWTYKGYTTGTPLVTSPVLFSQPEYPGRVGNNRAVAHIFSAVYYRKKNILRLKYSYSQNYGNSNVLYHPPLNQHSMMFSWQRSFLSGRIQSTVTFGLDAGDFLGTRPGAGLNLSYSL